jgi:hypothetical protein
MATFYNEYDEEEEEYVPPEPPRLTASELIERDVSSAKRILREFISELAAKHMKVVCSKTLRQAYYYNAELSYNDYSTFVTDINWDRHHMVGQRSTVLKISVNRQEWFAKYEQLFHKPEFANFEHIGIAGDWMIRSCNADYMSNTVHIELVKVFL